MTKEELVTQCLADNPVMIQTLNDVERELSEEERIEAANAWADMRLEQIALEEQLAAEAVAKAEAQAAEEAAKSAAQAKLTALGLTVEDLQALGL
jgi:FKBP-type peptidyl-prolyl cis-trans isomerase